MTVPSIGHEGSSKTLPPRFSVSGDAPSPLLAAALAYAARGWSVVPCEPRGKRPLVKWADYQKRRADADEIRAWWRQWPKANVAIVTGAISGMVVVDADGTDGLESIQSFIDGSLSTPAAQTGKGGHFYFRHPGQEVRNFARKRPGLDFRGDGGYVIAPPSVHANGNKYSFWNGLEGDRPLADLPKAFLDLITAGEPPADAPPKVAVLDYARERTRKVGDTVARYVESAAEREIGRVVAAPEGTRNDVLNQAAFSLGQLVGADALDRTAVEQRLVNAATRSGLSESEARPTIASGLAAGILEPRDLSRVGNDGQGDTTAAPRRAAAAASPAKSDLPVVAEDVSAYRLDRQTAGKAPPRRWLVVGALPLGVTGVLFGAGGVGKSLAVLDLALKVATRRTFGVIDPLTFLGPVAAEADGTVVFITLEDDRSEIHRRIEGLDGNGKRTDAPLYVIPGLDVPGFDPALIRQEGRAARLTRFAETGLDDLLTAAAANSGRPVRLLVLDPAGDLMEGSEDDAATVKPLMRRLREVAARHGCTVLLVGHTAKGQMDQETVASRGMRGSGAWIANARAAFGLWRPEEPEAQALLRHLDMLPTAENVARVVFGRMVKANHPGANTAVRRYLQDASTGLLHDYSDRLRGERRDEMDKAMEILVAVVKEAAELELPFQIDGAAGLYKRRADLPAPLSKWGEKKLRALGNEALEQGRIEKCRITGSSAPRVLDVPGGGYATGLVGSIRSGSLADARRRKAPSKTRTADRQQSAADEVPIADVGRSATAPADAPS